VPDQEPSPARAGLVPWRRDPGGQVLVGLVPQDRGAALPTREVNGRHPLAAALRAVRDARLGPPGPRREVGGRRRTAPTWYWPVEVLGGHETLTWLLPAAAAEVARDAGDAVVESAGWALPLRQVVLVRHARAGQRSSWDGPDAERPLDARGRSQAATLSGLLAAYGVQRIHSSDSRRCLETVTPLGAALGLPVLAEPLLSEDGSADDPAGASRAMADLVARPGQAVLCTQRKTLSRVLPDVLPGLGIAPETVEVPGKGGLLVLHLSADGSGAASVEALAPPPS